SAGNVWRFADQSSLPDTYQMRFALEGFVARMAALAISDIDIEWFEDNIAALHGALAAAELDEAAQLDFEFHMRIVSIAGNAAIESILRSSAEIMKESQRMPFYRRELVLTTYHEHRAILDALKARDADAAGKAIETHIANAAQRAGVYFPTPTPRP
ncbi:MAG: FCD domain-containing protein, partial [Paraburkholderia sp.]|nr:FCD domain-containing protein [Paraburkholderia sp.]